jgi:hypothetical protein
LTWSPGFVLVFAAQPAFAARLLHVVISHDGATVVRNFYDDNGTADAATVWRYLQRPPERVDGDAVAVAADPADPLAANLTGDITVSVLHGGRVVAQASLSALSLRRDDARSLAWRLPAAEVERTAAIAGLGKPSRPPIGGGLMPPTATATAIAIVMAALTVLLWLVRRPGQPPVQ